MNSDKKNEPVPTAQNETKNLTSTVSITKLAVKLVEVMAAIDHIAKSGMNTMQNYSYARHADIAEAVRSELAKRNVFVFTSTKELGVDKVVTSKGTAMNLTRIETSHTFVDADSGESMTVTGYGQGSDTSDKGAYKAQTGAIKYFLLTNFMIPTEDDPEKENGHSHKPAAKPQAQPQPQAAPQDNVKDWGTCPQCGSGQIKIVKTGTNAKGPWTMWGCSEWKQTGCDYKSFVEPEPEPELNF